MRQTSPALYCLRERAQAAFKRLPEAMSARNTDANHSPEEDSSFTAACLICVVRVGAQIQVDFPHFGKPVETGLF